MRGSSGADSCRWPRPWSSPRRPAGRCAASTRRASSTANLKPGNLFLARADDGEIVKLLDFGIAKETAAHAMRGITQTGEIVGSLHYLSPEQLRTQKDLDERTDLWSLGVILFRALTGRLPFEGNGIGALVPKILVDPIPSATALAPWLPPAMAPFFAKALARDRAQRFQSVQELLTAFTEAAHAHTLPASVRIVSDTMVTGPTVTQLPGFYPRPKRTGWIALGVASFAVCAGMGSILHRLHTLGDRPLATLEHASALGRSEAAAPPPATTFATTAMSRASTPQRHRFSTGEASSACQRRLAAQAKRSASEIGNPSVDPGGAPGFVGDPVMPPFRMSLQRPDPAEAPERDVGDDAEQVERAEAAHVPEGERDEPERPHAGGYSFGRRRRPRLPVCAEAQR